MLIMNTMINMDIFIIKLKLTRANIFMHILETRMIESSPLRPRIWKRYIDDVFAIYQCTEEELEEEMKRFNTFHPTIKFTYQQSTESIDYLDTTVYVKNGKLHTKVYKKPTDAGLYLHHTSFHPNHQF